MIKLVRVDHRLLHGQVIFSWTRQLEINHIIIADDNIVKDSLSKMALTMAKPTDCKLDIVKITEVSSVLSKCLDNNIMILVKGPKEANELTKFVPEVQAINFGGIAKKENSISYGKAIYLNESELAATQEMIKKGINIFIQQVPSAAIETTNFMK
ncbi:PTS sugar transporter subunit IIB [Enterococcus massiliensis]|uniref:PTS sugar transporter subunit IIB n=1 Tax=Enterococcus massiliensis TaxID=1640685 RepID=UPI00065E3CDF|nr:PTS sugar transporter subunit IIB [Enterococcus massiliensis]